MSDKKKKEIVENKENKDTTTPPLVDNSVEEKSVEQVASTKTMAEVIGRKTPKAVYLEEAQKTARAKEIFSRNHQDAKGVVQAKKDGLTADLKQLRVNLDEDIAKKLQPTAEEVKTLTNAVDAARSYIAELEEKLATTRKTNTVNLKQLRKAESKLDKMAKPLKKEYHENYKTMEKAGRVDVSEAQKQEKVARKEMSKAIRQEKNATIKNTAKATLSYAFGLVAAIPDITVKAFRSFVGSIKELGKTFNRVSTRASKEYKKPTRFTKLRNKPDA